MNIEDTCKHTKIRLIAAAIAYQQCTQTAGTEVQITGTDKRILIGDDAYLAKVVAPAAQAQAELTDERILQIAAENSMKVRTGQGAIAFARAIEREVRLSAVREDTLTIDALAAAFKRAGLDIQWVGKDVRKPMTYGSIELAELLKVFNELRVDGAAVREARNEALEEAAQVAERCYAKSAISFELGTEAARQIRALKAASPIASKEESQ
jgi:hypothetical protein